MKQAKARASGAKRPRSRKNTVNENGDARPIALDSLDEQIIAAMRKDGRISNRDLAALLGLNEATIRTRLRRLEDSNIIRVVAIRDLAAMGHEYVAAVGVQVRGRSVADVAADLATIEKVLTVNITIGANDLEVQVVASDIQEMGHLLNDVLANVKGVARLTPGLALRVLKYESQWAPLS
jgi:Lrp/AsnC family transcriptional regulator for asnA, asnC and gidA